MDWNVKTSSRSVDPSKMGWGSRIFGTLFFGVFFLAGLFATGAVLLKAGQQVATHFWASVPCKIEESRVETNQGDKDPYHWVLQYTYTASGGTRTGTRWRRDGVSKFGSYEEAERLAERYPAGSRGTCRVSSSNPDLAVLENQAPVAAFGVFFTMIFLGIGAIGLYAMWKPQSTASAISAAAGPAKTLARKGKAPLSGYGHAGRPDPTPRTIAFFFGIFLLVGLGMGVPMLFLPLARIAAARSWRQVPCIVESSQIRESPGDDSSTFAIDILYRYEVDGQTYKSSRYDFMAGTSSGYQEKAAVVNRTPPGTQLNCWVDPADPHNAVIERGYTPDMIFALFPIGFMAVGFTGVFFGWRAWSRAKRRFAATAIANDNSALITSYASDSGSYGSQALPVAAETPDSGPVVLKEQATPLTRLIIAIIVALFWNGIVSIFVYQAIKGWREGSPDYFLTLFMTPFALIGIGLIGLVVYSVLALFTPRPRATLTPGRLTVGGSARFEWTIRGSVSRISTLRLTLEGCEQASYRRGTNTRTDRSVFCRAVLFETSHPMQIASGSVDIAVPSPTMHSFSSRNNKIAWTLKLRGEIARWPDMSDDYEITVDPLPARSV